MTGSHDRVHGEVSMRLHHGFFAFSSHPADSRNDDPSVTSHVHSALLESGGVTSHIVCIIVTVHTLLCRAAGK